MTRPGQLVRARASTTLRVARAHASRTSPQQGQQAARRPQRALRAEEDVWRQAMADVPSADSLVIKHFREHWRLVQSWGAATNLTAIRDEESAAWLHYRDSLQACPHLTGQQVVDFGSGAGFPGIVLAIAMPGLEVTLVEPRRIRVEFLEMAVARLGLTRVRVLRGKTSSPPPRRFDHAVTRATFSDGGFISRAQGWLTPTGSLICYRGAEAQSWGVRYPYALGDRRLAVRPRCLDVVGARVAGGSL